MKSLARVFRYEFNRQGRRPAYLFFSIGVPILVLVLYFGFRLIQEARRNIPAEPPAVQAPNPGERSSNPFRDIRPLGLVDHSGLLKEPYFGLKPFATEEAARAALQDSEIGAYYVVAADYLASGKIDMYFDRFNLGNLSNQALRQVIVASLGRKLTSPVPNLAGLITRLQAKESLIVPHNVAETGIDQARGEGASFVLVYVFALLLLFSAFTTSGYLMQSVVEEKENRMVEILLSSMRPRDLLAGKILALGLLGLFQMLVWGGVIVFLITQFSAGIPGVPVTPALVGLNITASQLIILAIYFVLGYMLFATLYASVGSIATNMREGPQIAAFVTIPAVIPLYALAVFAAAPNGPLPVALSLIPLTAPLSMVMRAAITDVPAGEVVISVILLTLFIGFTMWLAGRLFRVNTLLSGQMPRLRDLVRLVRENV